MQWTDAQRAAIDARAEDILVSAAAGSGKTAVLIRRVTRLVEEGGDITRMMIVTFTRAAAAEIRERVMRALEENPDPEVSRQAQHVGRAQISTIHKFCLGVIREHFQALDVDPLAHIGENALLEALKTRAVNETLEKHYAAPTEDDALLFAAYEDQDVVRMLDALDRFLMALSDPWGWAERAGAPYEGTLKEHPGYAVLTREAIFTLERAQAYLTEAGRVLSLPGAPERYQKTQDADESVLALLLAEAERGELQAGDTVFSRLPSGKKSSEDDPEVAQLYQNLRKKMRETTQAARDVFPKDEARAIEDYRETLHVVRALCALCREAHEYYFTLKQQKNWLDYNDLEHLCYRALSDPAIRDEVAAKYDAIFVDEYQDVSEIQEAIFSALHRHNTLFTVGDVKQSIYRFRQADPTLFLHKYAAFSDDEGAARRRILLKQNFRSTKNVLASVNHVFFGAMRERVTEIEYDADAALYPADDARDGEAVEVHLLTKKDAETGEDGSLTKSYLFEAELIAKRIHTLLKTFRVHDREGERAMKFRDAVILLRNASAHAAIIARVLQENGIPVYSDADARYFELSEVADVLNLLRALDNPFQDIPLLSALRCPCFHFTEEELARVRIYDTSSKTPFYQALYALSKEDTPFGRRLRDALATLDTWRVWSAYLPVDTLIRRLLTVTGIHMMAGAYEDGEARQANLRLLAERAGENGASTLHEFLDTVERMRMSDDGRTAKTLSDQEDVVRIMTMHKSKGLEFPVVFLMELANPFRAQSSEPLMLSSRLGAATQFIDPEARVTRSTFAADAIVLEEKRKRRAEEARVLYVAMTRAKEKLILLASPKSLAQTSLRWSLRGEVAAGSAACMFDWVGQALYGQLQGHISGSWTAENGARFDVLWDDADALMDALPKEAVHVPAPDLDPADPFYIDMLTRALPPDAPMKTSVSALAKKPITEEDAEETPKKKRVSRETMEDRPLFMQQHGMTGAERGSALHKALGCVDYAAARLGEEAIGQELDRLRERAVLSAAERAVIRAEDVARFFSSAPGQRALNAAVVRREWDFNLRVESGTLVQGVLDLCFQEEGAWVLVDYKSDAYASPDELLKKYSAQMRWYARALTTLTDLPVKEILLYGIRFGDVIPVPADEGQNI